MIVCLFVLRRCKSNIIFNYYNETINKKFKKVSDKYNQTTYVEQKQT